ncbi:tetratricopeptide repeat protein [Phenylobacterium sp. NIBR 498073]|uniref:tetratricopeptide repeat protein n=1 Tax=Phenylobacterium sp. NIBR 498073 TaxID=3015177 RepID=UPI0022B2BE41|nr:tetratricopeptide repeat protein [Phenylobacterium sp. NIBR 498073]WGU40449.1 tetratricopeptide repeat protein [Phenylobacterium sp. NIBR 498073]
MFGQFLSELKRRNVIRVAALYTVTAWGIFQVAKTIFETLDFPKWTSQAALVVLALGLPITAIIAWAFERAPDGSIHRTTLPEGEEAPPRTGLTRMDVMLLGGMGLVLGVTAATVSGVMRGGPLQMLGGPPDKSVAVLPFTTFSRAQDAEYFADGLTEEVINSLAQSPELKVAGRTSSFYFKGKNQDLREVGKKLGVAHVVEGSVRREGDRLRVTCQLVACKDGFHLWSETYDRQMIDALALQTEIGEAVAEAMKVKLALRGARPGGEPRNPDAYALQLTSMAQLRRQDPESLKQARTGFEKLMDLEPRNAAAFAGYAQATMVLAQQGLSMDIGEAGRVAQGAIDKAVQLDPESPDVWMAKAMIARVQSIRIGGPQYEKAFDEAIARTLKLAPNKPEALSAKASRLNDLGQSEQAVVFGRKALTLDPLNRSTIMTYGKALMNIGQLDESERQFHSATELYPDYEQAKYQLAMVLTEKGRFDEAEPWLKAIADGQDPFISLQTSWVYMNLGLRDDADAVLRAISESPAKELGEITILCNRGDWPGALAMGRSLMAKDDEPFWPMVVFQTSVMTGKYAEGVAALKKLRPDIFSPEPAVTGLDLAMPTVAAHALNRTGDRAQAKRLLDEVLKVTAPTPGQRPPNDWLVARAKVFAEKGMRAEAIAALESAYQNGWRGIFLWDESLWLDQQPNLAALREDPAIQALMAKARADLARQREAVLAQRA